MRRSQRHRAFTYPGLRSAPTTPPPAPGDEDTFHAFVAELGERARRQAMEFVRRLPMIEAQGLHQQWGYATIDDFAREVADLEPDEVASLRRDLEREQAAEAGC